MPDRATVREFSTTGELSCRYSVTTDSGTNTSFSITAELQRSFVERMNAVTRQYFGADVFTDTALCLDVEANLADERCPENKVVNTGYWLTSAGGIMFGIVGFVLLYLSYWLLR
jgi:hypothetical protein